MSSNIKYVVIDSVSAGEEIILFPATRQHKEMAVLGKIVSGGFVGRHSQTKSGFHTYGESLSLGLKTREQDQELLDMLFKERW